MRRLAFRIESSQDAVRLTHLLMEKGLSVDRMPKPTHTEVQAVGDFDGSASSLVDDFDGVEITEDAEV